MKCPRFTHQNPASAKFCSDCGQMMGAPCPGCKTVNLPESNFCNQRGQFIPKMNSSFSDPELPNPLFPDVQKHPTPQSVAVSASGKTMSTDGSGSTGINLKAYLPTV